MTEDPQPSVKEFLAHAWAWRRAALVAALCVIVPALAVAALLPPSYKASATLTVLPAPEYTVRNAAGSHDPNTSALPLDQIMEAETAILDSRDLHLSALRQVGSARVYPEIFGPPPGPAGQALRRLWHVLASPWRVAPPDPQAARLEHGLRAFESDLTLLPTKDSNVVTVSFINEDGAVAAAVVNALLDFYAARRSQIFDDPQLKVLRGTVAAAGLAAEAAETRLDQFKRSHGISDYPQQRGLLLHRLAQEQQEAAEQAAAQREQQARLDALTRVLRSEPASVPVYHEQDPDFRLQAVNGALADLRGKLAAAREKYLESSRVVAALRASIASTEDEAARLDHSPEASVTRRGRNPNLEALRLQRDQATADLAAASARHEALLADTAVLSESLARLDDAEQTLENLQRRKAAADENYRSASRILADRHLSEAEETMRLARVRVVQPAVPPQKPRPVPLLVIIAGLFTGVVAAGGRVMLAFLTHRVFYTAEGLERLAGIPVLADFTARELVPEPEFRA